VVKYSTLINKILQSVLNHESNIALLISYTYISRNSCTVVIMINEGWACKPFHPYRPVWYVPEQGKDFTILDT